jgi:hypothetical protein
MGQFNVSSWAIRHPQLTLSQARVRLDRFNFGPLVGFPVQFRIIGPDPEVAHSIAGQVRDVMRADRRLIDPYLDWGEKMPLAQA